MPLCIRCTDFERAFDNVEYAALIFKLLRAKGVHETCYCSLRYLHWIIARVRIHTIKSLRKCLNTLEARDRETPFPQNYLQLNKQLTNKLRTAQRAMERKMLDLKLKDKTPCSEISKRTKIIDIIEYTLKQKWKWAGHIARLKDNTWTKRCTEWQPRRGKRSRGRTSRRWQDDITEKEGTTWIRKATDRQRWKTLMEGYILQWTDKA